MLLIVPLQTFAGAQMGWMLYGIGDSTAVEIGVLGSFIPMSGILEGGASQVLFRLCFVSSLVWRCFVLNICSICVLPLGETSQSLRLGIVPCLPSV